MVTRSEVRNLPEVTLRLISKLYKLYYLPSLIRHFSSDVTSVLHPLRSTDLVGVELR